MRYVILGAAPCCCLDKIKESISTDDYIICADGGYDTAIRCGFIPNLCVGDMDSIEEHIDSMQTAIIRLPDQKDDTDLMYAVKLAESKGAEEIILLGAMGGRIDHTFGNLCVLKYLCEKNIKHKIVDKNCEVIMACNQTVKIENRAGATVSVFPFGCDSCTVTYSGMAYPASSKVLYCNDPVGVSNIVNNKISQINVEHGTVLIFIDTTCL